MEHLKWIMSEGGPLICIEDRWAATWGGIDRLTVAGDGAVHDYNRTCRATRYLETIALETGSGLVIAPLDTAVWRSPDGTTYLVRIWYCEADFEVDAAMRDLDPCRFENPAESLPFLVTSTDLVIFDSAEPGDDPEKKTVSFALPLGAYTILTKPYEPSPNTSLILHRFDPS